MLLDKVRGERIGQLGDMFLISPVSQWRDTPWFEIAAERATESFIKAGGVVVGFPDDTVTVQLYPETGIVAIVFAQKVQGKPMYSVFTSALSPGVIADLMVTGKWKGITRQ